jgi:hypothetical protein
LLCCADANKNQFASPIASRQIFLFLLPVPVDKSDEV